MSLAHTWVHLLTAQRSRENYSFIFLIRKTISDLGNDLYLAPTWQYDFETKNVYEQTAKEVVNFYDFSESKTPVKFVYSETDYDWIYAELDFRNVDEAL